jgi:hypothetical protein
MKPSNFTELSISIAVFSVFCGAQLAAAADHMTPLSSTPKRYYPSGANISQKYERPDPSASAVVESFAGSGQVSTSAAMHNLLSQPKNRTRSEKQLTSVLRSQTRIQLNPENGLVAPTAAAAASAPSLFKFTYGYQYKDVPLWKYSAQSQLIHVKNGVRKTLMMRERNAPDLSGISDTTPTVATDAATKVGMDDCRDATTARLVIDDQNDGPHREIHVDLQGTPTLAWTFVVRSAERKSPFARRYWVAAKDEPKVLAKEDMIYHCGQEGTASAAALQGKVSGNIFGYRQSPFDPPAENQGINDLTAVITASGTIVTDANGFFSFQSGTLSDQLVGPFCKVINDAGSPLTAIKVGNTIVFKASAQEELAQVSAFKWVSTAHSFVADFVKNNDSRLKGLPTHVNIDETCNAFFDPNERTLNFFKAGDGCANSAYCDVACHEFGHAVDDQFGEIMDGGYSEGFGDSLAMLITRDSIIGRDFQGKGNHLRNATEIHTWPPADPEVHEVGKIYGGFTWELIQRLISKLDSEDKAYAAAKQLVLGAAALNPKDTPDAVRLSFLVDRQNGSPFFNELAAAADSRKIPRPASPEDLDNPILLSVSNGK